MIGTKLKKPMAMAGLVIALAATSASVRVATATADTGQPSGGCHMLLNASVIDLSHYTGLDHMMAGSANGNGADNMIQMLLTFYPDAYFCGL